MPVNFSQVDKATDDRSSLHLEASKSKRVEALRDEAVRETISHIDEHDLSEPT